MTSILPGQNFTFGGALRVYFCVAPMLHMIIVNLKVSETTEIVMSDDDEELFLWHFNERHFNVISSQDHCQRSSPLQISDMPQAACEPVSNPCSGLFQAYMFLGK